MRKIIFIYFQLIFPLTLLCHDALSASINPKVGGFEDEIISNWDSNQLDEIPEPIENYVTRVTADNPVFSGKYAARFYLWDDADEVNEGTRAELKYPDMGLLEVDNERWLTFSVFVPQDWAFDEKWDLIAQLHTYPDKDKYEEEWQRPPLAFYISGDTWRFINRYDPSLVTPPDDDGEEHLLWSGGLIKNRWVTWTIYVRLSCCDQNGLIEIWKDNVKINTYAGPNTYNNPYGYDAGSTLGVRVGHFFKFGIYKSAWNGQNTSMVKNRTIYFDEVYVGKTADEIGFNSSLYVNNKDKTCGGKKPCYSSIQAAIDAAGNGFNILIARGTYTENAILEVTKSLTLIGGWNSDFSNQTPNSTFIKDFSVPKGSLTLRMVTIIP